jgi:hypothetical protein
VITWNHSWFDLIEGDWPSLDSPGFSGTVNLSPAIAQSILRSDFVIRKSTYQLSTPRTRVSVGSAAAAGGQAMLIRVDTRAGMIDL